MPESDEGKTVSSLYWRRTGDGRENTFLSLTRVRSWRTAESEKKVSLCRETRDDRSTNGGDQPMSSGLLEGITAIVTGAALGMGKATAQLFAQQGANVPSQFESGCEKTFRNLRGCGMMKPIIKVEDSRHTYIDKTPLAIKPSPARVSGRYGWARSCIWRAYPSLPQVWETAIFRIMRI